MKINTKKSPRTRIVVAGLLALLLAAGGVAAYLLSQPKETTDTSSGTIREQSGNNQTDTEGVSTELPSKSSNGGSETQGGTDPHSDTPGPTPEPPTIARASQSGETVKVVATLSDPSNGKCTLIFDKSGQERLSYQQSVTLGPSYYSCSFSIPTSDFPVGGEWTVTVVHTVKSGVANSEAVGITVQK